ncbi:MAG: hypothetical protein AAGC60_19900 [Acidobacteriota bacterium]
MSNEVTIDVAYTPGEAEPISVSPDPVYIYTDKFPNTCVWNLKSPDDGACISRIVFEGAEPNGPMSKLQARSSTREWVGPCLGDAAAGQYKYSVFITNGKGEEIELDPQVIVDPDLGPG